MPLPESPQYHARMGLDGISLVLRIERRFRITLPDADVSRVRTVADLAALVLAALPRRDEGCATARTFFRMRPILAGSLGVDQRMVRPRARLAELRPLGLRRAWSMIRRAEPRVPRLELPPWLDTVMSWTCTAAPLLCIILGAFVWIEHGLLAAAAVGVAAPIVGGACVWLHGTIPRKLPEGIDTVADLVHAVAPMTVEGALTSARLAQEYDVVDEVRRLTAEELAVPLEQVRPHSDLYADLGMD